jgi:hypothetical protein
MRHIQAKIMSAVQDLEMELFTMHIMQLPADAQERTAFIHNGVFSRQWIYEFEAVMNGLELREIFAIYMGLPSPACSGSVGKRVVNTNSYLDRYGRALHSEKARPGDASRIRHNAVMSQIVAFTRRYG